MNELRGKVAFVTGATSSTGRAVALSLARRGADIAAFDRWENDGVAYTLKLDRLKQEVEQMGVRCLTLCGNSMKDVDVMVAVAETVVELRRIDILFNDTGSAEVESASKTDEPADNNFRMMWLAARHVIPKMLLRGEGTIITCAAGSNVQPLKGWEIYGVANPFSDVSNTNIKINAICPAASSDVRRNLQIDGWTQLSQCQHTDLVTAVQDLVAGIVIRPSQGALPQWRA